MEFKGQSFPTTVIIGNVNNNFNPEKYFKDYYSWELYNKNKIYNFGFEKDSKRYVAIQFVVDDKKYIVYERILK